MGTLRVRKNFNFTQVLNGYFQAIVKEPELIDTIDKKAKKRTGSFIGMLDGSVGNENYKEMKKDYNEHIS